VARDTGDFAAAAGLFEESLSLNEELNDHRGIPVALAGLGQIACLQGDHAQALPLLAESLARFQAVNNAVGIAGCLEGLAAVALATDHYYEAAQLGGAAAMVRSAVGAHLPAPDRALLDCTVSGIRTGLGDAAFMTAWDEGGALSLQADNAGLLAYDGGSLLLCQGQENPLSAPEQAG